MHCDFGLPPLPCKQSRGPLAGWDGGAGSRGLQANRFIDGLPRSGSTGRWSASSPTLYNRVDSGLTTEPGDIRPQESTSEP